MRAGCCVQSVLPQPEHLPVTFVFRQCLPRRRASSRTWPSRTRSAMRERWWATFLPGEARRRSSRTPMPPRDPRKYYMSAPQGQWTHAVNTQYGACYIVWLKSSFFLFPRPRSAFFIFCSEFRPKVKGEAPGLSIGEVAKRLGEMWNGTASEDKQPFEKKAAKLKEKYEKVKIWWSVVALMLHVVLFFHACDFFYSWH